MEKKPFDFPTWETFINPWVHMYGITKYPPNTFKEADLQKSMDQHFDGWTERLKRYYALDFLSALMEYINEGWEPSYNGDRGEGDVFHKENEHWFPVYPEFGDWEPESNEDGDRNFYYTNKQMFAFETYEKCSEFLTYKGCGTDTITQLNILYNIK